MSGESNLTLPEGSWFRLLAENAADGLVLMGADGPLWVSPSSVRELGWTVDDFATMPALDIVHPDDRAQAASWREQLAAGAQVSCEVRLLRKDGSSLSTRVDIKPIIEAGVVLGHCTTWRDISSEVATRTALAASEARLREIAENAADVVAYGDNDGIVQWITDSITTHLGWAAAERIGLPAGDLVHKDDREGVSVAQAAVVSGEIAVFRARMRHADGAYLWFEVTLKPHFGDDREVIGRIASWRCVQDEVDAETRAAASQVLALSAEHERDAALRALVASERRFRAIADNAPDVIVYDVRGMVQWVSPSLSPQLRWNPEEWTGRSMAEFVHPDDVPRLEQLRSEIEVDKPMNALARLRDGLGHYHWLQIRCSAMVGNEGVRQGFISSLRVADDDVEREALLTHLAERDELTGTLRRDGVLSELAKVAADARVAGIHTGVLFVDLDSLKSVNDRDGHAAGDAVLRRIADAIRVAVRSTDTVARVGGDEFLVLLLGLHGRGEALDLGEAVRTAIARTADDSSETVSIGMAMLRDGESATELVDRADRAMYAAKKAGGDRVMAAVGD